MKLTILELKEIQTENFTHYVKYERRLFFWSKPELFEAFRHKNSKIYLELKNIQTNCNAWFDKEGYEINSNWGIYFSQVLDKRQAEIKRRMRQTELNSIKV